MNDHQIIWRYILAFVALLILALVYMAYEANAATPQRYMLLYEGAYGLNFYCVDELPYNAQNQMIWDAERGAIELEGHTELIAQIVAVDDCNLDNVYMTEGGNLYTWRFTSHNTDGHENHRHLTRGAYWITWLRDLYR